MAETGVAMRGMLMLGGATLLGGGAYASGAFDRGEYYAMDPATVEARLAALNFGPESKSAQAGLVLRSKGPAVVRWDMMMDGQRIADVRAHLSPDDTGTRVNVTFAFTKGDALMGLEEDPFLNEVAKIAMTEKVDSTLDGRAFNENVVGAKLAAAVASDPEGFANMQMSLHQNVSGEMKRSDDPYYDDRDGSGTQRGISGKPTSSAKPMVSAKPDRPVDFRQTHADGGWGKN